MEKQADRKNTNGRLILARSQITDKVINHCCALKWTTNKSIHMHMYNYICMYFYICISNCINGCVWCICEEAELVNANVDKAKLNHCKVMAKYH